MQLSFPATRSWSTRKTAARPANGSAHGDLRADRVEAEAGQRRAAAAEMDRQLARWRRLMGRRPRREGRASVVVLTRGQPARTEAFAFVATALRVVAAARM